MKHAEIVKQHAINWAKMPTSQMAEMIGTQMKSRHNTLSSYEAKFVRAAMMWILGADTKEDLKDEPQ